MDAQFKDELKKKIMEKMNYSESSAKQFISTIQGFRNEHYPKKTFDWIFDKDISRLRKVALISNPNTKRNVVKALLVAKQALDKPRYTENLAYYRNIFHRTSDYREKKGGQREPIEGESIDKAIEDLQNRYNTYHIEKDDTQMLRCLPTLILGKMITELPTRRAMDYRILQLKKPTDKPKDKNYYSKGRLFFNRFKGSLIKNKKSVSFDISPELRKLFNHLRSLDRKRQYLIERDDRGEYSISMFSKFVKNMFGLKMNDLRKLCVQKNTNKEAIQEAKELADNMSHSFSTQQRDYA